MIERKKSIVSIGIYGISIRVTDRHMASYPYIQIPLPHHATPIRMEPQTPTIRK